MKSLSTRIAAGVTACAYRSARKCSTLTDDGYSVADTGDVPADSRAAAREAIECCPEQAITES